MTDNPTVSIAEAKFVDREVNGKYTVKMPLALALEGRWDNWERARFQSMHGNLRKGDVLFDVGAETGAMSAIYAQFVGPESMCLFESNPDNWQNVFATWQEMGYPNPKATVCALVGRQTSAAPNPDFDTRQVGGWPVVALTGRIWTPRSFRYLHQHTAGTPQISLDDFCAHTGIVPKGITIDVEGGEFEVLEGARNVLIGAHPHLWVSIHPDLAKRDYNRPDIIGDVADVIQSVGGYIPFALGIDHEHHFYFRPRTA